MNRRLALSSLCALPGLAWLAPATLRADEPAAKPLDADALVGTWRMVSVAKGDSKKDGAEFQDFVSTFTKDALTQNLGGMKFVYSYKLDPAKTPTTIALEVTESPFGAGTKATGIIKLEGETLTLAYSTAGGTPTAFDPARAGDDVRICVMKRSK